MLGDLDDTFSFLPHIAFTELRPDITIFANKLKRVILIELTCPCKENVEARNNAKLNKYMPLKIVIENNCWSVDLFAQRKLELEGTALYWFYVPLKA